VLRKPLGETFRRAIRLRDLVSLQHWCSTLYHMVVFWGWHSTIQLVTRIGGGLLRWRGFKFWGSKVVPFISHFLGYMLYPIWLPWGQRQPFWTRYCIIVYFISIYIHRSYLYCALVYICNVEVWLSIIACESHKLALWACNYCCELILAKHWHTWVVNALSRCLRPDVRVCLIEFVDLRLRLYLDPYIQLCINYSITKVI